MLLKDAMKPEVIRLSLRRKSLWSDYSKASKSSYDPSHPIQITFCGEQAIDDGGPRREFFSSIMMTFHTTNCKINPSKSYFLLSIIPDNLMYLWMGNMQLKTHLYHQGHGQFIYHDILNSQQPYLCYWNIFILNFKVNYYHKNVQNCITSCQQLIHITYMRGTRCQFKHN